MCSQDFEPDHHENKLAKWLPVLSWKGLRGNIPTPLPAVGNPHIKVAISTSFDIPVTSLTLQRYDAESKHVFVGDYAGQISVIKLEADSLAVVTVLKGHTGKFWSSWFGEGDLRIRTYIPVAWSFIV